MQCTTHQIFDPGSFSTALTLIVHAERNALPVGEVETILQGMVDVEGGGELVQNVRNNRLNYVTCIGIGATLAGQDMAGQCAK
ncbi:MAG: hypothetical protein H7240_10320 [Glaciimonas sp.]|nr:hypothetical protein [Glaciimonas sp.]